MSSIRVNISISTDLHQKLQRQGTFNWSAVAAQAFEDALNPSASVHALLELQQENDRLRKRLRRIKELAE